MNTKQRRLTWVAITLFILTLLAVPIAIRSSASSWSSYAPVFAVGSDEAIRFDSLLLEWAGIAVLYVGLFFVFRKRDTI